MGEWVMGAPKGNKNRFRTGWTVNDKGYERYTSGPHRWKYAHRVVVEGLLKDPVSYMFRPGQSIPGNMTVDHIDHNKRHNCHGNLMMLELVIHGHVSEWHRQAVARMEQARWDEECKESERWN